MADLTSRERVILAIQHQELDRVPYYISYTGAAGDKLAAYYDTQEVDITIGNDVVRYSPRTMTMDQIRPGFFRDEFGVVWNRSVDKDIGIPEEYLLKGRSLEGFTIPDPLDSRRYQRLPAFIEKYAGRFLLISYPFTFFERAWSLRSMPELMVDMLEAPDWVDELFEVLLVYNRKVVKEFLRYEVDGFLFGDDWGQQQGLLFGPALWRRFVKPRLAQLVDMVKQAGRAACVHSCGKVQPLIPDLIEIGVDVFNPFQPDVMDVYQVKREFGDRLAFCGGMSVQSLLPHGSPQQVRDEARRLMDEVGRGGGFIIGPSHHMPGDIPIENMVAFIETVREG